MAESDKDVEQRRKECLRKSGVLLSQRDYTCMRLRDKLLAAGFEEEIVEMTLESLKEARYLDDERYARNFIQAHWEDRSRTRIRADLENRGVPSDIAVRVLSEENEERGNSAEIMQVRRLMKKRGFGGKETGRDDPLSESNVNNVNDLNDLFNRARYMDRDDGQGQG